MIETGYYYMELWSPALYYFWERTEPSYRVDWRQRLDDRPLGSRMSVHRCDGRVGSKCDIYTKLDCALDVSHLIVPGSIVCLKRFRVVETS